MTAEVESGTGEKQVQERFAEVYCVLLTMCNPEIPLPG